MPTRLDPGQLGQLARSAQAGSAEALNELLEQLYPKLYHIARRLTGSRADAEDLTQDVCLKLLDALPQLRDPQAVLGWAETITQNACINHLHRKRPYLFQTDEEADAALGSLPEEKTDAVPDQYMDMAAKREIILGMIDALPEAQRLTVYLYYYGSHSVQEVAQLMGVSEGTVKSRLAAARASLKSQVEEEERRGNKLYLVFPFLGRLLREDAQSAQGVPPLPVTAQQIAACAQQCAATAGAAGGIAAARTAEKAAAAKGGSALATKVIAGVVAVALLAGGAVFLPRLFRGDDALSGPETSLPAPSEEGTATPTPSPEPTPEPSPEPSQDPTDFDPVAMIGQPLSALVAIAGEPTEQDGAYMRWNGGFDYDFSVVLADDGQTIRELFIIYGPPVLGLTYGATESEAQAALAALGDPRGVETIDTGGGQTSYACTNPGNDLYYQFDCINGAVFNYSIHDMNW